VDNTTIARILVEIADLLEHQASLAEFPPTLLQRLRLQGVGPKTAALHWRTLQVRTLDDLEDAARAGHIRTITGMGAKNEPLVLSGVKLAVSSDAHGTGGFGTLTWGVVTARRAWLRPEDVLDTRPADEMLAGLRRQLRAFPALFAAALRSSPPVRPPGVGPLAAARHSRRISARPCMKTVARSRSSSLPMAFRRPTARARSRAMVAGVAS
jgi:hypothetical protein